MELYTLDKICKSFTNKLILKDVCFNLKKGEVVAVLGKSGVGKSTLLKIISGSEKADRGEVLRLQKTMKASDYSKGNIIYMFQEALLLPHLSIVENVSLGLKIQGVAKKDRQTRVLEVLKDLELVHLLNSHPSELSGGEKQRVAFARAIVIKPELLLLDEPFASLDNETKAKMHHYFIRMVKKWELTVLFVTHDHKEALIVSDRIAFLDEGDLCFFKDKMDFIMDKRTGARTEMDFWSKFLNH